MTNLAKFVNKGKSDQECKLSNEAVRHLWGKLGMLLQRGNAAILANRVPAFPAPAIDGMH